MSNNSAMKGSSLLVASILVGLGTSYIPTDKWFGLICLISGGVIFFVREYFLKK